MKVEKPIYPVDSYSARCDDFFTDDHDWSEAADKGLYQRGLAWYSDGAGFAMREIARDIGEGGARRIVHGMFYVAMLAVDVDTEARRYAQWFIVQRLNMPHEEVWYTTHYVEGDAPDGPAVALADSLFLLQNGFAAPNEEDLLQLGMLIELGSHEERRRMPR